MSDQAQGLRNLAGHLRGECKEPERQPIDGFAPTRGELVPTRAQATLHRGMPAVAAIDGRLLTQSKSNGSQHARVLAVTSGKGGVGKSNFSINLAVTLGKRGKRVIMLDADMGLANAHILLGASPPFSLAHVMQGTKTFDEIQHKAAANVQLIAGGSGIAELADLSAPLRDVFLAGLRGLDSACDLIVIDTGAGVASNVIGFLCAVNEVIVVTTPEPTAIVNAYATIKVVSQQNIGARIMLVVNMVHSTEEGIAVAQRLSAITHQFLDLEVEYIGCIPIDPAVPKAVRLKTPFVFSSPDCPAAAGINQIIRRLGYSQVEDTPKSGMAGFVSKMQRYFGIKSTG